MNRIRLLLMSGLPLLLLGAGDSTAKTLIDCFQALQPEPIIVDPPLVPAERTSLTLKVLADGTVTPRTESQLVPEVSVRVVEVSPSLAAGGFFDEGDVLLKIERQLYEVAIVLAEAAIEQARLRSITEGHEAETAPLEWNSLGTGEPSPLLLREPQIAELAANLQQARYDPDRTVLVARSTGRGQSKQVDFGQFVQPWIPLATLNAVDVAEDRLRIPNSDLESCNLPLAHRGGSSPSVGPPVELTARLAGGEHSWQGRIVGTAGDIDARPRTVNAIAQVHDPYSRGDNSRRPPLTVGMFVQAEIDGIRARTVVLGPRSAIRQGNTVYLVDGAGGCAFARSSRYGPSAMTPWSAKPSRRAS